MIQAGTVTLDPSIAYRDRAKAFTCWFLGRNREDVNTLVSLSIFFVFRSVGATR